VHSRADRFQKSPVLVWCRLGHPVQGRQAVLGEDAAAGWTCAAPSVWSSMLAPPNRAAFN